MGSYIQLRTDYALFSFLKIFRKIVNFLHQHRHAFIFTNPCQFGCADSQGGTIGGKLCQSVAHLKFGHPTNITISPAHIVFVVHLPG